MSMIRTLNDEKLMRLVPSAFTQTRHETRTSEKYNVFSTAAAIATVREMGWSVVGAKEQRVKIDDRRGYQKHIIHFGRTDMALTEREVGDIQFRISLWNAHDCSSAVGMSAGLWRTWCSNQAVIMEQDLGAMITA